MSDIDNLRNLVQSAVAEERLVYERIQAKYAERWDLRRLFLALRESVSFHIVGSEGDPFEPNQIVKARERLGDQGLDIRIVPGGHMTTLEQPEQLARIIQELGPT